MIDAGDCDRFGTGASLDRVLAGTTGVYIRVAEKESTHSIVACPDIKGQHIVDYATHGGQFAVVIDERVTMIPMVRKEAWRRSHKDALGFVETIRLAFAVEKSCKRALHTNASLINTV